MKNIKLHDIFSVVSRNFRAIIYQSPCLVFWYERDSVWAIVKFWTMLEMDGDSTDLDKDPPKPGLLLATLVLEIGSAYLLGPYERP